jgi:hypothetical protein
MAGASVRDERDQADPETYAVHAASFHFAHPQVSLWRALLLTLEPFERGRGIVMF